MDTSLFKIITVMPRRLSLSVCVGDNSYDLTAI